MSREASDSRLREAQRIIRTSPGQKSSYYADKIGMHRYDFNTLLAMLNERGFHLWEDNDGRIWLFDPRKA